MSLPAYPRYRDSAHPWLGDVPEGWQLMRVKHALTSLGSGGTPDTSNPLLWSEEAGIPWVAIGDMSSRNLIDATEKSLSPEGVESKALTVWPPGTLLFSMYASLGHVAELAIDAATNQAILALLPNQSVFQGFLKRWFESIRPNLRQEASSNTQDNLNAEKVRNLPFLLPAFSEQVAISGFLDRETAKIDALIAEQETLLTLLAEKRQATISHAVTRGLDPDVPMKDSGIAWLGEVPAHWDVMRVKDVARLESGHTPSKQFPEYWDDCDIPWVSLNDSKQLAANDYISETAVKINALGLANSSARMLPPGAVVFTRDATIGLAAITTVSMAVSQHLIAWCPSERIHALFLLRVFNAMKAHLDSYTFGATIKTIGMGDVKTLVTPLPPLGEQEAIVKYIDSALGKLDAAASDASRAIALLKERRSALIAAAVTGKIDVRGQAGAQAA